MEAFRPLDVDLFACWWTHQIPHPASLAGDQAPGVSSECIPTGLGPTEKLCQPTMVINWYSY